MTLETHDFVKGNTLYIEIIGFMDYSTIDHFNVDIPAGINRIIINFKKLDFIDSTGIGAVLSLIYRSVDRGVQVDFEGLEEPVKELFDTIGIFRIIEALQQRGR
jgi:stage II sporulation protein AA (anti-sigma F factor antagonist)